MPVLFVLVRNAVLSRRCSPEEPHSLPRHPLRRIERFEEPWGQRFPARAQTPGFQSAVASGVNPLARGGWSSAFSRSAPCTNHRGVGLGRRRGRRRGLPPRNCVSPPVGWGPGRLTSSSEQEHTVGCWCNSVGQRHCAGPAAAVLAGPLRLGWGRPSRLAIDRR